MTATGFGDSEVESVDWGCPGSLGLMERTQDSRRSFRDSQESSGSPCTAGCGIDRS
jgi:hypothetical protein